jgi:hypothetical protein
VGGQRQALAALHKKKTQYPLYRKPGGPQGRSGRVQKISSQPGFDPQIVQHVASHYIDYAIPAHKYLSVNNVLQGMWKEAVMVYIKVLYYYSICHEELSKII